MAATWRQLSVRRGGFFARRSATTAALRNRGVHSTIAFSPLLCRGSASTSQPPDSLSMPRLAMVLQYRPTKGVWLWTGAGCIVATIVVGFAGVAG